VNACVLILLYQSVFQTVITEISHQESPSLENKNTHVWKLLFSRTVLWGITSKYMTV